MTETISFVSYNSKGLRIKEKRIKIFEYLKNSISHNGFIFLQETHSHYNDQRKWEDQTGCSLFFSHGKTNSCGVLIGFVGTKKLDVLDEKRDKNGRILILKVLVEDNCFTLINLYSPNTESDQVATLTELSFMLNSIDDLDNQNIILGGDLNFFFDTTLEASGGNPTIKKNTLTKFIELKENFNLCDIWRIRNPKTKRFTFRQKHASGFIQRRLDYFFISTNLQYSAKKTDVLASFCSDHSPILLSFCRQKSECTRGKGLWKFNSSLTKNNEYVEKMKKLISDTLSTIDDERNFNDQMKWEYLKFTIRNFSIEFSKTYIKLQREERSNLEKTLKDLEAKNDNFENNEYYIACKNKLDSIYEEKANGIKIRSKCNWYEQGEKSSKFFLNLEKKHAVQGQIRSLLVDEKEINEQDQINKHLLSFYDSLFSENIKKSKPDLIKYLDTVAIPKLNNKDIKICEGIITEDELFDALCSMENNKSPGNDGLTKEFYETFWNEIKRPLMASILCGFNNQELSTSQRQAVIKLIEKKDRDKRLIKNWRPISLLNTDMKLITKVLASRIKQVMPSLISFNQTAYVENRFIGESGRLIADILDITETLNLPGFLVTIDIEKAFDSVNHNFLITALEKYGFGKEFIYWIKTILKKQESCIINGGTTTKYFHLKRGTRQGDPISAYLFILVLEIFFLIAKKNPKIEALEIFNHKFLYTAYADDTTFFFKNEKSIIEIINLLTNFSEFSGLKPNKSKCEIVGIGALKGVNLALCGMKSVNLNNETIKVLGTHFSYNKILEKEKNFRYNIESIQTILKIWRMRNLSLLGKITVFKSLAISKIIHLALITTLDKTMINHLEKIQRDFIWDGKPPKIKHAVLCQSYENGGLKNVDILTKIASIQCSWVKRLFDKNFHDWKIIPTYLIHKFLGKNFKFHNSIAIHKDILSKFPFYYQEVFVKWKENYTFLSTAPSTILSEYIWYNSQIKIDNKPVYFNFFSEKQLNFVGQFFDSVGNLKNWDVIKIEFGLQNCQKFSWVQLIHALPKTWKLTVCNDKGNAKNLALFDHHLSRNCHIYCLQKLTSKELYQLKIDFNPCLPTARSYFETYFKNTDFDWKNIYLLPRRITVDTYMRMFQYKILNNILYLNKMLVRFGIKQTSSCSYCKLENETALHLFAECIIVQDFWNKLRVYFSDCIEIPAMMPQSAIFGYLDDNENSLLINHLLLIFKCYIYKSRDKEELHLKVLIKYIYNIRNIEENLSLYDTKKTEKFNKKWGKINSKLTQS